MVWPYYERLEKLLALSGPNESDDEQDSQDQDNNEVDEEDTDDDRDSGPGTSTSASATVVNRAIRNLLQTNRDPVLILEDVLHNRDSNMISTTEPVGNII